MKVKIQTQALQLTSAAALLLSAAVAASAAGNSIITFSVDLTGQVPGSFTPGTSKVFARGTFNNWTTGAYYDGSGSSQLTNNPSALNTNIGLCT